jgi:hypothetical protein
MDSGRMTEALACAGEAAPILQQTGAARPVLALAYAALAATKAQNGDMDDACTAALRAIQKMDGADPADDINVLNSAKLLGTLTGPLLRAHRVDAAELFARNAADTLRGPAARNPAYREDLAHALYDRSLCLKSLGQMSWLDSVQEAIQLLRRQQADGLGTRKTQKSLDLYLRFRADMLPPNVGALQQGSTVEIISRPGRNDPCPCGSGQKYKRCCGANDPSS